jgi:outer membrane immunogenic protein
MFSDITRKIIFVFDLGDVLMKQGFIAKVAMLGLLVAAPLGVAQAADMAVKAPPPIAAPIYNWTGFYIGAVVGGDFGRDQIIGGPTSVIPGIPETNRFDTTAFLAGATAGYNYQFSQWVLGIEGDYSGLWGGTTSPDIAPLNTAFSQQIEQHWIATVRGRLGYTVLPNLLVYGTGGFAASGVRQAVFNNNNPGLATQTIAQTQTMDGWTAGFGLEWKVYANWSVKAEYLYVDLGTKSFFTPAPNPLFVNDQQARVHNDIVRFGVNYTFGGNPIVAKY